MGFTYLPYSPANLAGTVRYEQFYNLREKPFKLVPNPDYLYFSPSHARALSHLQYASAHGDGFVLITGEVGTGKTTLSRCYLSGLGDDYASAYIFNTKIDSIQLLLAICHEFGIHVSSDAGYQALLNAFNQFLMVQHQADRKVVLLVDEAQNLTTDNLEMVRLLSNLETTHHKLLHIVLVGQPELAEKLETRALRQLSQRISLRCRLELLTKQQTQSFIKHRVMVAAIGPSDLFSIGACRLIHQYARGIPRCINIAADQALLKAFELKQTKVHSSTAAKALRELRSNSKVPKRRKYLKTISYGMAGLILGAALIVLALNKETVGSAMRSWYSDMGQSRLTAKTQSDLEEAPGSQTFRIQDSAMEPEPQPQAIALPEAPFPVTPAGPGDSEVSTAPIDPVNPAETIVSPNTQSLEETPSKQDTVSQQDGVPFAKHIAELEPKTSRMDALANLLTLWQQPRPHPGQLPESMADEQFFRIAALQYGLKLMIVENDWPLMQQMNLPAVVAMAPTPDGETVFTTLASWQGDRMRFSVGAEQHLGADPALVRSLSKGPAYIFWYHNLGTDAVISQEDQGEEVLQMKKLLRKIGYSHLSLTPVFDPSTYHAVVAFQMSHGIEPDGLVGPLTKIMLMAAADGVGIPRLEENK